MNADPIDVIDAKLAKGMQNDASGIDALTNKVQQKPQADGIDALDKVGAGLK